MAMTRGMTAKQNPNASNRKRRKTLDDNGCSASWSCLVPDILLSIILRLGVVDFVAFSGVCKSWRTVALSNKSMFMLSRRPMAICVSTQVAKRKECCLKDCEGRKFMSILPRSSGRIYVGLASGYLILFGRKTRDFMLVNPITRHELYFPHWPFHVVTDPDIFRGTLVFSPAASSWVFVMSPRFSRMVSFSLSSKQASWTHLSSNDPICDLQFFQGKIYALTTSVHLCEVKLYPKPTLTLLKMKNLVAPRFVHPEFATLGEKLLVTGYRFKGRYGSLEVDFEQMKWASPVALKEYPCFVTVLKYGVNKLEFWEEPHTKYPKLGYFQGSDKDKTKRVFTTTNMWYFPHKCLDVNLLHE